MPRERISRSRGNKTYYAYDDAKRVTGTWTDVQGDDQSSNRLVTYAYDAFGNKSGVTTYSDANTSRVTTYTYDKMNRVTKIVYPYDSNEGDLLWNEYYQYDSLGRLQAKLVGMVSGDDVTAGAITAYDYDSHDRLSHVKYNYSSADWPTTVSISSADVTYGYDGHSGLKTSMVDLTAGTSSYTYDIQGRTATYAPPVGTGALSYTYNNLGQKTGISESGGGYNVQYEYFANGWLKNVKTDTGSPMTLATYVYDTVGNRTGITYNNSTRTAYAYGGDSRYLLSSTSQYYVPSIPELLLGSVSYPTRDASGNPLSMTDSGGTTSYSYDDINRLGSATYPGQSAVSFGYDWVGNRLNPPTDPNPMEYNKADQLTFNPYEDWDCYYDKLGNLVEKSIFGYQVWSYGYSPDGLMTGFDYSEDGYPNIFTLTMAWDADSNRVHVDDGTTEWTYTYDPTAGIPAVLVEDDGSENPIYYFREPDGSLIARRKPNTQGCGTVQYYHFDELGSTRMLTDICGDVTDTYAYDAWGNVTSHTGSTTDNPYQYVGQLGYYTDNGVEAPWFGLLQLGVRFYDAGVGRFTQRDPARAGMVAYDYADDEPIDRVDPTGLWSIGASCSQQQSDDIEKAMNTIWNTMSSCLSKADVQKIQDKLTIQAVSKPLPAGVSGRIRTLPESKQLREAVSRPFSQAGF